MTTPKVDEVVWNEFLKLCARQGIKDPSVYLQQWLKQIIKHEELANGRYVPVAVSIVTRNNAQVLIVGNEYARGEPLVWNLPGGAAEPGEQVRQAAFRELYEECGIQALTGRLAWIVQVDGGERRTGILAFAFEITKWKGEITLDNEEIGGLVRRAEFVPFDLACQKLMDGSAIPFRDWLAAPQGAPRLYWNDFRGVQLQHF